MSFKRYTRELYDHPKASVLPINAQMVKSEVVEALLYGFTTRFPLKGHFNRLRTTHHSMLLQILGARCKSSNKRILSCKDAFQRTECESTETAMCTRGLLWCMMSDHRLPKRVASGALENAGKCGPGGEGEMMDGLRGRRSSAIWQPGGLEHRRT